MDLERFENSINDKFKNFEPEIDDTMIWDAIEGDIPSKKTRKPFWLLGFFLLPAAYCLFLYQGADKVNTEVSEVTTNVQNERVNAKEHEVDTKILNANLTENAIGTAKTNLTKVEKEISAKKVVETSTNLTEVKTVSKTQKIVEERITAQSNQTKDATFAQARKESMTAKETAEVNSKVEPSSVVESGKTQFIEGDVMKNITVATGALEEENGVGVTQTDEEESDEDESEKVDREKVTEAKEVTKMKAKDTEVATAELGPVVEQNEEEVPLPDHKKTKMNKRGSLSLTGGVYLANRLYEQFIDPPLSLVIAEKETVEKQLETLQLGLQYKYRVSQRFSLGVGLRYWRLAEESTYIAERDYQGMIDVLTAVVHHVDGTTTETFTTVPVEFNEQIEHTRYQTHTSYAVPVKAYYALVQDAKKRVELGLGYEQSISGKHVGYELVQDRAEYLITQDANENYENTGGNFLLASISTDYKIGNSIEFTAGLEGKYGLNGFNTESAIFRKKYHFLGLYAGLNYTF